MSNKVEPDQLQPDGRLQIGDLFSGFFKNEAFYASCFTGSVQAQFMFAGSLAVIKS